MTVAKIPFFRQVQLLMTLKREFLGQVQLLMTLKNGQKFLNANIDDPQKNLVQLLMTLAKNRGKNDGSKRIPCAIIDDRQAANS